MNLGARERTKDERDFLLGSIQAPVTIPASYSPDLSWLTANFQGETPTCGAHAASHLQAILEHQNAPAVSQRYTPRYSWIKIKQIDGFPLEDGTDMRSIFKSLASNGADDFEPLENDVTLPLETYSAPSAITSPMDADAANQRINSYAFANTDFSDLCQAIYQNKAVLLLIKCDNGFWGTANPTFTTPEYGHFIVAYGYTPNSILIVDSADSSFSLKEIGAQYITSEFIIEAGTALDIPPAQVQALVTQAQAVVSALPSSSIPAAQQLSILTVIENLIESFFPKVGSASPQSQMSKTQTLFVSWGIRLGSIALVAILNYVVAGLTNGTVQLPIPAAFDPILGSLLAEFVDWLVPYEGTPPATATQ